MKASTLLTSLMAVAALGFLAWERAVPVSALALDQGPAPVVVELFTSEGCSSCPPAETLLRELGNEPGILPLAFHVDYWNRLGWPDPFSSPESTARQYAYARSFGGGSVYTPQTVVQGAAQMVGSSRGEVLSAIAKASRGARLPVSIHRNGDTLTLDLPMTDHTAQGLLLVIDRTQTVKIKRGENAGRTLTHINVVRDQKIVPDWNGKAADTIKVSAADLYDPSNQTVVVLVQALNPAGHPGPILGSAVLQ